MQNSILKNRKNLKRGRKMNKKIFASLLLASASLVTLVGCDDAKGTATDGGEVLNIYCWNNEFQGRFRNFYPEFDHTNEDGTDTLKDGTVVKWVMTANQNNAYQNALDGALEVQETAATDDKVDMFLIEADYALKYCNSDYSLDIKKKIGLTDAELEGQYGYTQDIVTDSSGALKGTSWQATPGLFAYRRSIAQEVLGTDDPAQVQTHLNTWDKFDDVAADMKAAEYKMLSGFDDSYRTFSNNISSSWVDEDKKIVIDPMIERWIDQTKEYTDNEYNNKTSLWDTQWAADQGPSGDVFGFFYSTWGINFTLLGNSLADANAAKEVGNGIYGDWAVCQGPASYYWGGTWMCAANGTDNKSQIKDIMEKLTCDKAIMKSITLETEDFTNNKAAMLEIANDTTYGSAFLGGQNHVALFVESADDIDMSNCSAYDQGLNEGIQTAFRDYFNGTVTKQQAYDNFYTAAIEKYPALSR